MVHARDPRLDVHHSALTALPVFILGMLIVLFSKCMTALSSPAYRRGEGIKWGLVSYTVVMFSLATGLTAMNIHLQSISNVDNREFPGVEGALLPGPTGYFQSIYFKAINVTSNTAYLLNNWLADGFLVGFRFAARSLVQVSNAGSSSSIVVM